VQEFLGTVAQLKTRKNALRMLAERLAVVNDPKYLPPTNTTFKQVAERWLENCRLRKRRVVKPSTLINWRSILTNHVLPFFKDMPLSDVTNQQMKEFVEVLSGKGLSAQAIKNVTQVAKLVKASEKDKDGNEIFPTTWNHDFIDMPIVDESKQDKPTFTAEQVSQVVKEATGRIQMACILFAATGLRAGELLGLEVRHFNGASVKIEQEIWSGKKEDPKTPNAKRVVDLHSDAANLLKEFIGQRTSGYIFQTASGRPLSQTNLLKRELHPLLARVGISMRGFHCFRRFRITFLRKEKCPEAILKAWLGHKGQSVTDGYDRGAEDPIYRKDVCSAMGLGFDPPKTLTPKVPKGAGGFSDACVRESEREVEVAAVNR
jgi:integrase